MRSYTTMHFTSQWASFLQYWTAKTPNLSQARCSFSLLLRTSYYSNHKKKNGDRHRLKASGWPERVSGWSSTTTPLFQVRFSKTRHLSLDKKNRSFQRCFWICSATKNDKVMVVQRSLHEAHHFTQSNDSAGENSSHQGEVTGSNNIYRTETGRIHTKFGGASARRRDQLRSHVTVIGRAKARLTSPAWQVNCWRRKLATILSTTLQISFTRFTAKIIDYNRLLRS